MYFFLHAEFLAERAFEEDDEVLKHSSDCQGAPLRCGFRCQAFDAFAKLLKRGLIEQRVCHRFGIAVSLSGRWCCPSGP